MKTAGKQAVGVETFEICDTALKHKDNIAATLQKCNSQTILFFIYAIKQVNNHS